MYDASYFVGRQPTEGEEGPAAPAAADGKCSGYGSYERRTSNADFSAYLIWSHFEVDRVLEVGAAMGFLVEALCDLGMDAHGLDYSHYAVANPAPGAVGRLRQADLTKRLDLRGDPYDLVVALETLEHLPPAAVPSALKQLRRASKGWLLATIPSFGPNRNGTDGFFSGKVLPDRLAAYDALGPSYRGPVPFEDLRTDAGGRPIEGHLTIASYAWWEERFADAGFVRCDEVEARLDADLERLGFTGLWNAYVFSVPGTPVPPIGLRNDDERLELEERWDLMARRPQRLT